MLTPKQQAFCDNYIVSHNATDAAIKAGYSKKTAYSQGQRLLKKVEIKKHLESNAQQAHTSKIADAQEILEFLTETVRNKAYGLKDRLKAAQMLGEHFSLYKDAQEIKGEDDSNRVVIEIVGRKNGN